MSAAQGGCLCGEIRYEVAGQPERVTMCHCRFCQRATGAAYMVQPAFAASEFSLTKGSPKRYDHVSEGSGKKIHINFCNHCGTKLFQTFERFEGAVGLYRGTLDDPNWLEITARNSKHIFLGVAQSDTIIPADTPVYMEHAAQNDGTAVAPMVLDAPRKIADL
ncbi:GFA family protein [Hoeflea ulvae]|uniref:GFA family protein n=1 Tax=Hoeflea ulvae TaxID=2983764 RepID=A0ABT3YJN5_9HYPH|nr:GFA family protein [Hoeflea ulvae]MCY0096103.1 GFA family protein [Hoeflea ulvae]